MRLSLETLAGRTGQRVRVAVVDSGIHAGHPHVRDVSGGVRIWSSGDTDGDFADHLGHGTAVAAAIREKAPQVELFAVRVFDRTLATTGEALVRAIEWSAEQGVQIINLSLGTTNQDHASRLGAAVAQAAARGAIVVSPAPQPDTPWLPGGLPGVVAVEVDWECPRDECHVSVGDEDGGGGQGGGSRIRVSASGYPRPIPGVPPERNFSGPSFAVANATGFLALVLEGAPVRSIAALADLLSG